MPQKTQKKENLPVKVDVDLQNGGTISYANEVIATIAGVAANEIDGIAGMCVSGGFGEILGRNKNITRGVKVEVGSQEAAVDLYVMVEYGFPFQKVAADVQENVRKALESLTGLRVVRVDVHVQGVSFEREKKAVQNSLEASKNPALAEPVAAKEEPAPEPDQESAPQEDKPAEEAAPEQPEEPAPAAEEVLDQPQDEDKPAEDESAPEEKPLRKRGRKPKDQPEEEIAEAADPAVEDERLSENKDFDPETLAEEAQTDGAPAQAEEPAEAEQPEEKAKKPRRPLGRKRC